MEGGLDSRVAPYAAASSPVRTNGPTKETAMPDAHLSNDSPDIEPSAAIAGRRTPIWAWYFAAICMVVPVLMVMSGLPAVDGVFGAVCAIACIFASRNSLPVLARVFICSLITAGAWVLYIWYLVVVWYRVVEIFERVNQIH